MNGIKLFIASLFFLVISFVGVQSADAQQPKAITIEPFLQEIIIAPSDKQKTLTVEVKNNTSSVYEFKALAIDFGSLDETGGLLFSGSQSSELLKKYGLAKWLVLDDQVRRLQPGESMKLDAVIDNRGDLAPGGHYAAIVLASQPFKLSDQGTPRVSLQKNISSLIFAKKVGGEVYDLKLQSINYSKNYFRLPEKIVLRFSSEGNVHLVPRGLITVKDSFNREVGRGIINSESAITLPATERLYSVHIKYSGSLSLPGKYKVDIQYRFDGRENFVSRSSSFIYIGWPPLLLAALVAGAILKRRYLVSKLSKLASKTLSTGRHKS